MRENGHDRAACGADRLCARLDRRPEACAPARRVERCRLRSHIRRLCIWTKFLSARPGRGAHLSAYRRHAGGLETRSCLAFDEQPENRKSTRLQSLMLISYDVFTLKTK